MGDLNDSNYQLDLNNSSIHILFTRIENTDLELTLAIKYASVNFRTVKVYICFLILKRDKFEFTKNKIS